MIPNSEWILLLLLAVVLLKPEEIPGLAKTVGKAVKYGKNLWQQIIGDYFNNSSASDSLKHPFCIAPVGAKTQPIKD